ncbi:fatty acyl-CoA reductase wat isoform X2 [Megachile rotundata]|uniref:fatty acyl-CoA reductase wat isoform X2 n=1 Tax=Megachile rotundata TaxID=143995 RepID=UPI003FD32946
MTVEKRIEKCFQCPIFDTLHKKNPNFMVKVQPIYGDLQKANLGFSSEDCKLLTENVDIVIHNAADVSFTTRISSILKTNVLGTKYMLDLAAKCSRLKAFVYVSTAYSHCYNKRIGEKFYSPPCDLNMVEDVIRSDESTLDGLSEVTLRDILGEWPNAYTFSKSIAESLVENFSRKTSIPCSVFRPSIVISPYDEPVSGWVANVNGPAAPIIMINLGVAHVIPIGMANALDIVPLDLAVNCLLATIWDLTVHKKSKGSQVYNYGSSLWKPFHMIRYHATYFNEVKKHPFEKMLWYPFIITTNRRYCFLLLNVLIHIIPAVLADLVLMLLGKRRRALDVAWKATKLADPLFYFITTEWILEVNNSQNILPHMNPTDYEEFPFDLGRIDWDRCVSQYLRGIKLNVMKESLDIAPATKKRYQTLKIAHYSLCILFLLFVTFLSYRIVCSTCY